jgi:protease-4
MSDVPPPSDFPPIPPSGAGSYRPQRPMPPSRRSPFLGCAFALSFALNLLGGVVILLGCLGVSLLRKGETLSLPEQYHSGNNKASDKVAIITLDGVILEGLLGYARKQIEQAASDDHVKAVVVRINSPGGSITASDDLHRRLLELRDGNSKKDRSKRPLIVSMGSMAASGGYYIAMPGETLFAEPTSVTGSIGVYTSFPNAKELADKYGFKMNTIKQGQIKDSGSPFGEMTPHERQVWQDMVDDAYQRFLHVVEKGRPMLADGKLLKPLTIAPVNPKPDFLKKGEKPPEPYTRYLADGGVWTADNALKYKLIDQIGTLDAAVQFAHDAAGLGEHYKAIKYERPSTIADLLGLGAQSSVGTNGSILDPARLEAGFAPRMWYLSPGTEVSGLFAAMRE